MLIKKILKVTTYCFVVDLIVWFVREKREFVPLLIKCLCLNLLQTRSSLLEKTQTEDQGYLGLAAGCRGRTAPESGWTLPPRGLMNSCPTGRRHTIKERFEGEETLKRHLVQPPWTGTP